MLVTVHKLAGTCSWESSWERPGRTARAIHGLTSIKAF